MKHSPQGRVPPQIICLGYFVVSLFQQSGIIRKMSPWKTMTYQLWHNFQEFQELPSDLVSLLVMRLDGSGVTIPTHWSFTGRAGSWEYSGSILFISQRHSLILFKKSSEPTAFKNTTVETSWGAFTNKICYQCVHQSFPSSPSRENPITSVMTMNRQNRNSCEIQAQGSHHVILSFRPSQTILSPVV